MIYLALGCIGFLLFILYDLNSVLWKKRIWHYGFLAGNILLTGSTIMLIKRVWNGAYLSPTAVICGLLASAFLGLLVYTLFFALPFGDTYQSMEGKPLVCDTGVYALCRHPGVLWFFFFYIFLAASLHSHFLLGVGMLFSLCNLGYVILQDMWTFPNSLGGYEDYKKRTPFLIPTIKSIAECFHSKKER